MTTLPTRGAGGVNGFFDDIGSNPLLLLGAGLLSGAGQPSFGQALGQGLQFMTAGQQQAQANQIRRQQLEIEARKQAAADRQMAAMEQLQGLFGPDPNAPTPLTPEGQAAAQQQQMLGLLAQVAPDQFAQAMLSRALPEPQQPTNLQREYEFLTELGVDKDQALEALRKGTVVNVGGDPEEPLSVDDLVKVRLPDGSTPPVGTTPSQARAMGAAVVSETERQGIEQAQSAASILDQLEKMAIGPGGIFTNVQPGFENRVASALDFGLEMLTQNDPRASHFKDLSEGTIGGFVRLLGERGALAEGDVQRAVGLLPRIFPLPDTGEVARDKIGQLREIIDRGVKRLQRGEVVTPPAAKTAPPAANDPATLSNDEILKSLGVQ